MRHLARFLLLLALCASGFGVVVDTVVNLKSGGTPPFNLVNQATINATENTITVQITPGAPRVLQMIGTSDWYYRSSSGGNVVSVPAGQSWTLIFQQTTTFYYVRQTADGTMALVCLR